MSRFYGLSPATIDIAALAAVGCSHFEIALKTGRNEGTVKRYLYVIRLRYKAHSSQEASRKLLRSLG